MPKGEPREPVEISSEEEPIDVEALKKRYMEMPIEEVEKVIGMLKTAYEDRKDKELAHDGDLWAELDIAQDVHRARTGKYHIEK